MAGLAGCARRRRPRRPPSPAPPSRPRAALRPAREARPRLGRAAWGASQGAATVNVRTQEAVHALAVCFYAWRGRQGAGPRAFSRLLGPGPVNSRLGPGPVNFCWPGRAAYGPRGRGSRATVWCPPPACRGGRGGGAEGWWRVCVCVCVCVWLFCGTRPRLRSRFRARPCQERRALKLGPKTLVLGPCINSSGAVRGCPFAPAVPFAAFPRGSRRPRFLSAGPGACLPPACAVSARGFLPRGSRRPRALFRPAAGGRLPRGGGTKTCGRGSFSGRRPATRREPRRFPPVSGRRAAGPGEGRAGDGAVLSGDSTARRRPLRRPHAEKEKRLKTRT